MLLPPMLRKFALTAHVLLSVGLLGAVGTFLLLSLVGLAGGAAASPAYVSMDLIARWMVVPMGIAALITGLIQSLGTPWGLFRHWWVVIKLLLTLFVVVVLALKLELITAVARIAAQRPLSGGELLTARYQISFHAAAGLAVLLIPMLLSIYKPRGMTRYGWRQ